MAKADEQLFVQFYYFWKWEYTRRNGKYKKKIEQTIAREKDLEEIWGDDVLYRSLEDITLMIEEFLLDIPDKLSNAKIDEIMVDFELPAYQVNIPRYLLKKQNLQEAASKTSPEVKVDYLYGSSTEILECLIIKNFSYKFPQIQIDKNMFKTTRYIDKDLYGIIPFQTLRDYNCGRCDLPYIENFENSLFAHSLIATAREERKEVYINENEGIFLIDLSSDLDNIIKEISFHKKIYEGEGDFKLARDYILGRSNIERKSRNMPRAVGLWLWDYVDRNKISWEHRAKAYSAFHDKYHSQNNQRMYIKAYTSDQKLASLLTVTNDCIKRMEILPMG